MTLNHAQIQALTNEEIVAVCLSVTQFAGPRIAEAITLIEQLQSRPDCTPQAGEWLDQVLAVLTRPVTSEATP
jgi:hypothetical protein